VGIEMSSPSREELIWNEWKRITRFIESTRIVFSREELIWSSLEIPNKKDVILTTKQGPSTYTVALQDHLDGIRDTHVVHSIALVASYALVESFGRIKLHLSDNDELKGGIESWGKDMLATAGHTWSDVLDGLSGLLEVSVIRNALSHGLKTVNQSMVNRFASQSMTAPWGVGDKIEITYANLDKFRARLKSLMRFSANPRKVVATPLRGHKKRKP
jgi:hypothetical protein